MTGANGVTPVPTPKQIVDSTKKNGNEYADHQSRDRASDLGEAFHRKIAVPAVAAIRGAMARPVEPRAGAPPGQVASPVPSFCGTSDRIA
jgi:hypothetical protein